MNTLRTRPDLAPASSLDAVQNYHRAQVIQRIRDGRYRTEEVLTCLCGSNFSDVVRIGDRFGIPVGMVICTSCGLLRTSPRLSSEALPAFYEEDYHGLHMGAPRPFQALYREGQGAAIYGKTAVFLSGKSGLSVFEIGCGAGTVLREFKTAAEAQGRGVTVAGCEYSLAYVEEGRRQGLDLRHGGIESLAGLAAPDLIILSHVLEHFVDMEAELANLASLCDDDTVIYIEVPGVMSIHKNAAYDYELARYFSLAHIFHFTRTTLTTELHRAGFRCLSADEHVSAVFRKGTAEGYTAPNAYQTTLTYLRRLESPNGRLRRAALQGRRRGRKVSAGLLRSIAGERGLAMARGLSRGLRATGRLVRP